MTWISDWEQTKNHLTKWWNHKGLVLRIDVPPSNAVQGLPPGRRQALHGIGRRNVDAQHEALVIPPFRQVVLGLLPVANPCHGLPLSKLAKIVSGERALGRLEAGAEVQVNPR